jgi:flagellar biosynthesis GTPase FlhF
MQHGTCISKHVYFDSDGGINKEKTRVKTRRERSLKFLKNILMLMELPKEVLCSMTDDKETQQHIMEDEPEEFIVDTILLPDWKETKQLISTSEHILQETKAHVKHWERISQKNPRQKKQITENQNDESNADESNADESNADESNDTIELNNANNEEAGNYDEDFEETLLIDEPPNDRHIITDPNVNIFDRITRKHWMTVEGDFNWQSVYPDPLDTSKYKAMEKRIK